MRSTRILLLVCLTATAASPAAAQIPDCGPDCLGLYFDSMPPGTSCLPGSPSGPIRAYVTLSSPTMSAISFMSIYLIVEGPVITIGVDFGGTQICQPIEIGAVCHFWDPPLPTVGDTQIASIAFLAVGTSTPSFIGLRTAGLTVDDPLWVLTGDGADAYLHRSTGPGQPLAQIGGDCQIVPTEARSWGTVKSLFR